VSLVNGDALLAAADHVKPGRGLSFFMDRTYRSGALGYGPLGSAGWSCSLFAHLREIPTTGEVEYYDGHGHTWRFYPVAGSDPEELSASPEDGLLYAVSDGYDTQPAGHYYAPKGVYLSLQRTGNGWHLVGRNNDCAVFDSRGRLVELSDRHRQGATDIRAQGNTLQLRYDAYGQLVTVVDDLGRHYRLEYDNDSTSPEYGLLKKVTDFAGRELEYEYTEERLLAAVKLPKVTNETEHYRDEHSYDTDATRPTVRYTYDSDGSGVTSAEDDSVAALHGDFARLRLEGYDLPRFTGTGTSSPRLRVEYTTATGRIAKVLLPPGDNAGSVDPSEWKARWLVDFPDQAESASPVTRAVLTSPWGHAVEHMVESGRVVKVSEMVDVVSPAGDPATATTSKLAAETTFTYTKDGRPITTTNPDGSTQTTCYPDTEGNPGCEEVDGGEKPYRSQLLNVVRAVARSDSPPSWGGEQTYDQTEVSFGDYNADNLPTSLLDPRNRTVHLPAIMAGAMETLEFTFDDLDVGVEGGVTLASSFDMFGRLERFVG
jgi:YD repeat-containing protein